MRDPAFWWRPPGQAGLAAACLAPVAALYGRIAAGRMRRRGASAGVPVICVGNFTLGGTGKTPLAIWLARMLSDIGATPVLLSRGYGGSVPGPLTVDPARHSAAQVGDEPLLLARAATTIVARDRAAGARAAVEAGASIIVMDDGLQNSAIEKDLAIAVVDGPRGVGNARVFPAGPLRAPLASQLAHVNALLVVGDAAGAGQVIAAASSRGVRVFHAALVPDRATLTEFRAQKVLAFAGIGDPGKFFATLKAAGISAPVRMSFPDHHRYSSRDAKTLLERAGHERLELLTTEKDIARMAGDPKLAALAARAKALPVTLSFHDAAEFRALVLSKIRK
ncbi:MAG: tetraacyldisaccharide 4'-kinase [Pseudolabrys sp.]